MIDIMLDWRDHFKDGRVIKLVKGDAVFRSEDEISSAYLVISGSVSLERVLPNGDKLVLNVAHCGNLLAEASLFTTHYHCDGIVLEETQIYKLKRADLLKRLEDKPQSLLQMMQDNTAEIKRLRNQIEILRHQRVAERLDAWLLFNETNDETLWVYVATEIGVSAPALYRELAKRKKAGK
ncbi:MAG: hypothetical protein COC17_01770 [Hyphomicrobiales bacterium]|nr:MAG: hypothetical protein COC17_01770 [Hyphomicrobiales bacterium]